MSKRRQLYLRLTQYGCEGFRWHCRKRKKLSVIDLPKKQFLRALWPGQGLTWATAVDIDTRAHRLSRPGSVEVECGEYTVTAYYREYPDGS